MARAPYLAEGGRYLSANAVSIAFGAHPGTSGTHPDLSDGRDRSDAEHYWNRDLGAKAPRTNRS